VVKKTRRRRLMAVSSRVGFGTLAGVKQILAPTGWQINTAFIERINLTLRQRVAAVGRRVTTLCKGEAGIRQQLAGYHVYYNFCLPHASLRRSCPSILRIIPQSENQVVYPRLPTREGKRHGRRPPFV
jgi:hypothetical protein